MSQHKTTRICLGFYYALYITSLLTYAGRAHNIVVAERVVLNFMQRMSGIATLTKVCLLHCLRRKHEVRRSLEHNRRF